VENKISMTGTQWPWQLAIDPRIGIKRRHRLQNAFLQASLRKTGRAANLTQRVTLHRLRHFIDTHLACMAMAPIFGPFKSYPVMPMSPPS
jgi:hypothetical protein